MQTVVSNTHKQKRSNYFDNVKAILIFLVVLGHFLEVSEGGSALAPGIRLFICFFCMPMFVFVSGLFFDAKNKEKVYNKVVIFFILYILMKIVGWLTNLICFRNYNLDLFDSTGLQWFMFALATWYLITPVFQHVDKKWILPFSILLAIVVGYDENINTFLSLSRCIVLWPFFLFGTYTDKKMLETYARKRMLKVICAVILFCAAFITVYCYDSLSMFNPLIANKNPYVVLNDLYPVGWVMRLVLLVIYGLLGCCFLMTVPTVKLPITYIGSRTISIYFYDCIVYPITVLKFTGLHFYMYFIISIVLTLLLSTKIFHYPINLIMKKFGK